VPRILSMTFLIPMDFLSSDSSAVDYTKESRIKFVRGLAVRSGRTVRAAKLRTEKVYVNEDAEDADRGWFHVYSYPKNHRHSDNSSEQIKRGIPCCGGKSHICELRLKQIFNRRGRNIAIEAL
jgi:hypothetical protein